MRAVFFLLLFANLAFLAWAEWIDAPQPAAANDVYAKLPRLKLVGEASGDSKPSPPGTSAAARKTALQRAPQGPQCLSFGPFYDAAGVARGTSLLQDKGLTPRERVEQGEVPKGFWVYIGGLKTDRDVTQVLRVLQQSHVEDAQVMPGGWVGPRGGGAGSPGGVGSTGSAGGDVGMPAGAGSGGGAAGAGGGSGDGGTGAGSGTARANGAPTGGAGTSAATGGIGAEDTRAVSVGLFSDRDRADRRAQSLQKLGLQPEVAERHVPGKMFWLDADVLPGAAAPTVQDFAGIADSHATVSRCPGIGASTSQPASSPPAVTPVPAAPTGATPRTKIAGSAEVHSGR